MTPRNRLRELYESGEQKMAREFARGVLQNQSVTQYSVNESTVTVETDLFVGTHDIVNDENGNLAVAEKGTYKIEIDAVNLTFTARSALSRVEDDVRADLHASADAVAPKATPVAR